MLKKNLKRDQQTEEHACDDRSPPLSDHDLVQACHDERRYRAYREVQVRKVETRQDER